MNDMVFYLVILAALVFVALFLWSRMEARRNQGEKVSLSQESREMYDKIRSVFPAKNDNPQVGLVKGAESANEEKSNDTVATEPFIVEDVQKHEEPREVEVVKEVAPAKPVAEAPKEEPAPAPINPNIFHMSDRVVSEAVHEEVRPDVAKPVAEEKQPVKAKVQVVPEPHQETIDFANTAAITQEEPKPEEEEDEVEVVAPARKEGLINFEFDDLTETVGMIQASEPRTGAAMVEMAHNLAKMRLPIRIYVRSEENKRWYEPREEGMYTEMAVVMLLANRQFVINDIDASRFCVAIEQAGIQLEADSDSEPAQEIVLRAKRLHEAITSLDVQLSVVLSSRDMIPAADLAEAARLAGFTQLNPKRFFLGSAKQIGEATIFLRVADFDPHQLTLVLDAPLASPSSKPLHQLFSVANDLSCRLGLEVQDTQGQPINSQAAQIINNQLTTYYHQMMQAEIQPGSRRARILFTREA